MANGDFGRLEFLRRLGRLPSQAQMVRQPEMGPVRVPPSIVRQPSTPALSPSMQRLADLNAARYVAGVPSPYRMPSPAAQPAVAGGAPAPAGPQLPPPPRPTGLAALTPRDRGALAASIAGLQYAGPQTQPTSFAQGLGVMAQAGLEAFDVARQREAEARRAEQEGAYQAANLALKYAQLEAQQSPSRSSAAQKLIEAGYIEGSPEFQQAMRDYLTKPTGTNINMASETAFAKESVQYAFRALGDADKAIAQVRDLEPRLEQITNILASGEVDTGRIASLTFPFRQILAESNMLSSEEAEKQSSEELLRSAIQYIIPRMRVVGSGSTSDKEMNAFAQAAPNFANNTLGNQKIASGMSQVIKYQKERRNLMDQYMMDPDLGNGTLMGFNKWADEKQGTIFKTYTTDESFDEAVRSGDLKVGDMYFNGQDYLILEKEHTEGIL